MFELTIKTTTQSTDIVSSILWDNGASGVSVDEQIDTSQLQFDYIDDNLLQDKQEAIVKGFFECDVSFAVKCQLEEFAKQCEWSVGSLELQVGQVKDDAWVDEFKNHFVEVDYGGVVVVPEWSSAVYKKPTVRLQLAAAFGTGKHQTTHMCIDALIKYTKPNMTVADVGCGSGVLGLVALSQKARFVWFCDTDSQAVDVTLYNLGLNDIPQSRFGVGKTSLLNGKEDKFDIIVANLTADILVLFCQQAKQNTHDKSLLIASGIILDKLEEVQQAFVAQGFDLIETTKTDDWALCVFGVSKIA